MTGTLRGVSNKHCLLVFFFIYINFVDLESPKYGPCQVSRSWDFWSSEEDF